MAITWADPENPAGPGTDLGIHCEPVDSGLEMMYFYGRCTEFRNYPMNWNLSDNGNEEYSICTAIVIENEAPGMQWSTTAAVGESYIMGLIGVDFSFDPVVGSGSADTPSTMVIQFDGGYAAGGFEIRHRAAAWVGPAWDRGVATAAVFGDSAVYGKILALGTLPYHVRIYDFEHPLMATDVFEPGEGGQYRDFIDMFGSTPLGFCYAQQRFDPFKFNTSYTGAGTWVPRVSSDGLFTWGAQYISEDGDYSPALARARLTVINQFDTMSPIGMIDIPNSHSRDEVFVEIWANGYFPVPLRRPRGLTRGARIGRGRFG